MQMQKLKKNAKKPKWANAFKYYTSSYSVEILKSFNPEPQLKNAESAMKNKLMDLLNYKALNSWQH